MTTSVPERGDHFEPIAAHARRAYLRYSFTRGTAHEVAFLAGVLGLGPGARLLDVGCGPGRHAHALAARGVQVVGLDRARPFLEVAAADRLGAADGPGAVPAAFVQGDARRLPFGPVFDAVISVCQGGFGLLRGDDAVALDAMAGALVPGGRLALTAFSSYFQVRHLDDSEFDPDTGVNHEVASVRDEQGHPAEFELWTTCFTPTELRLLAAAAGLVVDAVWSVEPGRYDRRPPDLEHPELLLLAHRPPADGAGRPGC